MGTDLRVVSESYPMNTNMTGFQMGFKNIGVLVLLDENSLSNRRVNSQEYVNTPPKWGRRSLD